MKRFLLSIGLLAAIFAIGNLFQSWNEKNSVLHASPVIINKKCDTLTVERNDSSCLHYSAISMACNDNVCILRYSL